jgi:hypothetical protein
MRETAPTIRQQCSPATRARGIAIDVKEWKMTLDQYNEAVKAIFADQQAIAAEAAQHALKGSGPPHGRVPPAARSAEQGKDPWEPDWRNEFRRCCANPAVLIRRLLLY